MNYLCAEPGKAYVSAKTKRRLTRDQKQEFSKPKNERVIKTKRNMAEYERSFEKLHPKTLEVLETFETGWDILVAYPEYCFYHIVNVCEGKRKTQSGFVWRYKNNTQ